MKERKDSSITVRLPQAMKETLESIAEAERRTLSQLVAVVLELYLETRDEWRAKARGRAVQRRSSTRRN